MMIKKKFSILFVSLVLLVFSADSFGGIGWDADTNSPDRLWSTAVNWSTDSVPLATDDADIKTATTTYDPIIDSTVTAVCRHLRVGNAGTVDILTMTGGTLTMGGDISFVDGGGAVTIDISGGTITGGTGNNFFGKKAGSFDLDMSGGVMNIGQGTKSIDWGAWATTCITTFDISAGAFNTGATSRIRFGLKGQTVITQTGGSVSIGGSLGMDQNNNNNNSVYNLDAGTCDAGDLDLKGNAVVDLDGGTLTLPHTEIILARVNTEMSEGQLISSIGGVKINTAVNPGYITLTGIPEPATVMLLGLGSLALIRRKR